MPCKAPVSFFLPAHRQASGSGKQKGRSPLPSPENAVDYSSRPSSRPSWLPCRHAFLLAAAFFLAVASFFSPWFFLGRGSFFSALAFFLLRPWLLFPSLALASFSRRASSSRPWLPSSRPWLPCGHAFGASAFTRPGGGLASAWGRRLSGRRPAMRCGEAEDQGGRSLLMRKSFKVG